MLSQEILRDLSSVPMIDTHEHLRFGHMIDFSTLREEVVPFEVDLRKVLIGSYMGYVLDTASQGAALEVPVDRR
ncbi:unnamed protein product, partial [marine sediment metagenome]